MDSSFRRNGDGFAGETIVLADMPMTLAGMTGTTLCVPCSPCGKKNEVTSVEIHEYQAKEILTDFGVPIPRGGLAYSPEQAVYRSHEIGGDAWVVKAQIHSGGRGKAGGIKFCRDDEEIWAAADELLGKRLITNQTGSAGKIIHRLYVEEAGEIANEYYIGFVLDRQKERISIVASSEGGVEIEDIASEKPDSLIRVTVEPAVGMQPFQAREIAFKLGIDKSLSSQAITTLLGCYRAFRDLDATMVEINPLVVTRDNHLLALDAKMGFDDNALFRRPNISELRDKSQEDPREMKAADRGLSYVGLQGNIGCIINGAGLAMATMDMIKHAGGEPANFLDIGGGASPERVAKAINLILADKNVRAVLVNIFAGINRCDWVAEGIVQALGRIELTLPFVVRLSGTNMEEGREILKNSGLPIIMADTLQEAADKAVAAWQDYETGVGEQSCRF
jgi:succinyl-CoA synthetase beta subunit